MLLYEDDSHQTIAWTIQGGSLYIFMQQTVSLVVSCGRRADDLLTRTLRLAVTAVRSDDRHHDGAWEAIPGDAGVALCPFCHELAFGNCYIECSLGQFYSIARLSLRVKLFIAHVLPSCKHQDISKARP